MMRVVLEDSKLGQVQTAGDRQNHDGGSCDLALELFGQGATLLSGPPCLDQNRVCLTVMSRKM